MMVPGVLLGLGMSLVANQLGIDRTWWSTAFVLHVVYTYPFAFLVMLAIFNRFDGRIEEVALTLGVTPSRTFRKVTFPIIFPGVLSAMLFAFTLSYDEFPRTLFTGGPDVTMPIAIYGTFSVEIHPNLFAFGVLTTLFSFALLAVYGLLMTAFVKRAQTLTSGMQEEIE
jgi:putative spermidine/putrescine transport system permease protein